MIIYFKIVNIKKLTIFSDLYLFLYSLICRVWPPIDKQLIRSQPSTDSDESVFWKYYPIFTEISISKNDEGKIYWTSYPTQYSWYELTRMFKNTSKTYLKYSLIRNCNSWSDNKKAEKRGNLLTSYLITQEKWLSTKTANNKKSKGSRNTI